MPRLKYPFLFQIHTPIWLTGLSHSLCPACDTGGVNLHVLPSQCHAFTRMKP